MFSSSRKRGAALVAAALGTSALVAGAAAADTNPSTARCPVATPDLVGCTVVKTTDGSIAANGNRLPLGGSITIEGGDVQDPDTGRITFVPPTSGDALTATPVTVPGGLFGTDLPYNLNTVKATVQQVGPVTVNYFNSNITAAVRIKFTNPLLGNHCYIGSAAEPITLNLTTDVTDPPAPNQPIVGNPGSFTSAPGFPIVISGVTQVDNAFAVPAATGCGIVAQSQVTAAINENLGLPSAAGTNDASLTDNVYITGAPGA